MVGMYAMVINVTEPLAERVPSTINNHTGEDRVSRETWVVHRDHLAQFVISRQPFHDILFEWHHPLADVPNMHLARRMYFPTALELETLTEFEQSRIDLRGGWLLMHPSRDYVTDLDEVQFYHINNALIENRVNMKNVHGMAGMHYHVVQEFLDIHANARSFRVTQYQHDNMATFFVVCVAGSGSHYCY